MSKINELKITIQADDKTVLVHVVDPYECAIAAKGSEDSALLADVVEFCEDVLEGNADAGKLEITPENAAEVLGTKEAAPAGAGAEDDEAADDPAAADTADAPVLDS